ncbi:hypothetical protein AB0C12_38700 [Actinoplanes sp. NPDC048967]|uniref:hypothetical protein n=1 Tax=Actinoplanes sp. NPDC048967 TaxID=3155269 RepID=UPI0033E5A382
MSMPGSPDERPARTSRLDIGGATAVALVSFALGTAVQPHIDLPWDRSGPAMADRAASVRLVLAQQAVQELTADQEAIRSTLAETQLTQASELVEAARATATDAERLNHRIYDRKVLMEALRMRQATAVSAQVPADRELQLAGQEVEDSRSDAADRISRSERASRAALAFAVWMVVAFGFAVVRGCRRGRKRLVHGRFVLLGGLTGVALLLLVTAFGWLIAAVVTAALVVGWILRTGQADAGHV